MYVRASRLAVVVGALAGATLAAPRSASAAINVGGELGIAGRSEHDPGFAFGGHAEISVLPFIRVGAYYLHYELGPDEVASFNAFGARARAMVPIPGTSLLPFLSAGFGPTFARYAERPMAPAGGGALFTAGGGGYFFEVPVGAGLAYQLATIVHVSGEIGFRPAFGFGGAAFEHLPSTPMGWTFLAGVALDL